MRAKIFGLIGILQEKGNMLIDPYNKHLDDEFRKEYEAIQPEMDDIRTIVDARTSQNMTQKELTERTDINQAESVSLRMALEIHLLIYLSDWLRVWEGLSRLNLY